MAKVKKTYVCQSCGTVHSYMSGKCNACNEWNSIVEEIVETGVAKKEEETKQLWLSDGEKNSQAKPQKLSEIQQEDSYRIKTLDSELNRVLGGGIVPGSLILIGGEPGIGKSTLLLQISLSLKNLKILYISGEESQNQIKQRASRLGVVNDNLYLLKTKIYFVHTLN